MDMPPLPGSGTDENPFLGYAWVRDLVWYSGPLLTELRDDENRTVLQFWCDRSDLTDRRLTFRITDAQLQDLILRRADLRSLVLSPAGGKVCLSDDDESACSILEPKDLPEDYVPDRGGFLP